jgi:lysylphosphatidylglycerol synthetase-like protein (DUF2156 family)
MPEGEHVDPEKGFLYGMRQEEAYVDHYPVGKRKRHEHENPIQLPAWIEEKNNNARYHAYDDSKQIKDCHD